MAGTHQLARLAVSTSGSLVVRIVHCANMGCGLGTARPAFHEGIGQAPCLLPRRGRGIMLSIVERARRALPSPACFGRVPRSHTKSPPPPRPRGGGDMRYGG